MEPEGTVRSVLFLYPKVNDYGAVTRYFRTERVLELSKESGGFLGGSVEIPTSGQGPMVVLARWRTVADYRRWADNPRRAALAAGLVALLDRDPATAETYSIVHEIPA